jgi:hypothetical protein
MGLPSEVGQGHIRHPDLDRAKPLGAKTLPVRPDPILAVRSHEAMLHVTVIHRYLPPPACDDASRSAGPDRPATLLADFRLIALTDDVRRTAATLPGEGLRSFDAIDVASAQQLGALLDVLVTYDHRMIDSALAIGLPVVSPG